jgi:hypothetical protein
LAARDTTSNAVDEHANSARSTPILVGTLTLLPPSKLRT